jgi:hypothetical protein
MNRTDNDKFSPEETRKRMEAALRGARIAGHKPMSEITPKKKPKRQARKKRADAQ